MAQATISAEATNATMPRLAPGRDVLGVFGEQVASESDHPAHLAVGDSVVDGAVLAAGGDEAAPAKAREVIGDARLGESESLDEVADRQLALGPERLEDPQTRPIGEDAEVLGEQLRFRRRAGDFERSVGDRG